MAENASVASRENAVSFVYTNWRGETSMRTATPMGPFYLGSTEWHPAHQWLFDAYDWDKGAQRTFALKDANFAAGAEIV